MYDYDKIVGENIRRIQKNRTYASGVSRVFEKSLSGKHNRTDISENTMKALITLANERVNYKKAAEISSEQNYNQIDGIINNEAPRTIGSYVVN